MGVPGESVSRAPDISVVVPVFEGEHVIRETIDAVESYAVRKGWEIEVVIGFSEGRDRTGEILEQALTEYDNIAVVDTTAAHGKGGAVQGAMALTRGKVRCFIDADSGVSFDQIDAGLDLLDEYDIAIGSRYRQGGSAGRRTLPRRILSRGGNLLIRLILGLRFTDTRAPLKVYRGAVADHLFPALRLQGFGFDSELLFLAERLGYRTVEFPVRWESGGQSTVSVPRDAVSSILELLQVRWHWLRGTYAPRLEAPPTRPAERQPV
jgi:dolichyl-phosphate beta-glucosyltransferase